MKKKKKKKHIVEKSDDTFFMCILTFLPFRNYLLSSSEDGTIRLWSLQTFTCLVGYKGHNYPVWDTQFSPHGYYFISGGHDRVAR